MSKRKESPIDAPEDPEAAEATDGGTQESEAEGGQTAPEPDAEPTPEDQLAEAQDKHLRAKAELENARRRARQDVDDVRRYGATPLLQSLLPALDALQRALAAASEDVAPDFLEGVRLTEQQLLSALELHGVTPVPAEPGTPFDPAVHRALLEQPTADFDPGVIVAEIVRGWRLHDRLLREAQVAVARAPEPDAD